MRNIPNYVYNFSIFSMAKKHSSDTHSRFLSFFSGDQGNENRENLELFLNTYLLLTEFEVRTVGYGNKRAINRRGKTRIRN